ncbi:MAG: nuclear transport factor 2 family protein [Pyrinomonadaceae bacterium]
MKSMLAFAVFFAALTLCNLTDKSKPDANANANTASKSASTGQSQGQAEQPGPSNRGDSNNSGTDRAALTVELMKLEYEVTTASMNGDLSTLAAYVADDYSGTGADGVTQNKNQLLASTKPDKMTKSWKITEGELVSRTEDSAVLTYIQTQTLKNGRTYRARITDTFVKRNGRWLVKSEQQTLMR